MSSAGLRTGFESNGAALHPLFTHGAAASASDNPSGGVLLPCMSGARLVTSSGTQLISLPAEDDIASAVALAPRCVSAFVAGRSGFAVFARQTPDAPAPRTFRPFENGVVAHAAYDSSAGLLAVASAAGAVQVYDCDAFHVTHAFPMKQDLLITALAFHPQPSAMHLFVAAEDGSVRCFDLATRAKKPVFTCTHHVSAIVSMAFVNSARWLVCAGKDRVVSVCKAKNGEKLHLMVAEEDLVGVAPLSSRPKSFVSAGDRGVLRVWDASKGLEDREAAFDVPLVDRVTAGGDGEGDNEDEDEDGGIVKNNMSLLTSSGTDKVTATLTDHTVLTFGLDDNGMLQTERALCGNLEQINDLRALPTVVASSESASPTAAGSEPDVLVASNSSVLWVLRPPRGALDPAVGAAKRKAEVERSEKRTIGTLGSKDKEDEKMDDADEEKDATVGQGSQGWTCQDVLGGHRGIILGVDAVGDTADARKVEEGSSIPRAAYAASGSRDKTARVWHRTANGAWSCVAVAEGHTDAVTAVALSPKTRAEVFYLATGANDRTLKRWGLKQAVKAVSDAGEDGYDAAPDASRTRILSSTSASAGGTAQELQLSAAWTVVAHDKDINAVAVSPDGRLIASGSQDKTVKVWDSDAGRLRATCGGHRRGVFDVCFSPVDRVVASSSGDGTVRLWNVVDGSCVTRLEGHEGAVLRAVFLTRGMQLVSSGMDGLLKVHTIRTGEVSATLDAHEGAIWAIDATRDGAALLTGGMDGAIEVHTDATTLHQAEAAATRDAQALGLQRVSSAARARRYADAADAALHMQMPRKLRAVLSDLLSSHATPGAELQAVLRDVGGRAAGAQKLARLLAYARDWAASGGAQSAAVSARVLRAALASCTPAQLCEATPEPRALVEALVAHTRRHEARAADLLRRTSFVSYTLEAMRALPQQPAKAAVRKRAAEKAAEPPKRRKRGRSAATEY